MSAVIRAREEGASINARRFGVVGDGVTDDTAALEAALVAVGVGGALHLQRGMNCRITDEVDFATAGVTLIGYRGAKITKDAAFVGSCMLRILAPGVTLDSLELDGTDQADDGIITSAGVAEGFTARGLRVYDCAYGISANSNDRVLIEGCHIDACASYCIRVHNIAGVAANDDIRIIGNRLDQRAQNAATSLNPCLLVRGAEAFPTTNVHIRGNVMLHVNDPTNSAAMGCEVRFGDGVEFVGNTCTGGAMLISCAASKNFTITGNVGIGQTFYCIEVASISASICKDVTVTGNTIRGNGILGYAIGLQGTVAGCSGCVVSGNAISGVEKYGVFSNDVWDDLTITGNAVKYADASAAQYGIYLLGTAARPIEQVTIAGNMLHGGGVGEKAIYLLNVNSATVSGNVCPGWAENGVYLSVAATVTMDDIAIVGNTLTPGGANAIGKSVAGTMGNRVTASRNAGFRLTNSLGSDILNYAADQFEAWGTGTPEGFVTAAPGSVFRRTNGGAGQALYIKESGTGNTGWVAK